VSIVKDKKDVDIGEKKLILGNYKINLVNGEGNSRKSRYLI